MAAFFEGPPPLRSRSHSLLGPCFFSSGKGDFGDFSFLISSFSIDCYSSSPSLSLTLFSLGSFPVNGSSIGFSISFNSSYGFSIELGQGKILSGSFSNTKSATFGLVSKTFGLISPLDLLT